MAKSASGVKASEFGMAQQAAHATIRQHKTPRERYRATAAIVMAQLRQLAAEGDVAFLRQAVEAFDLTAAESAIFD